MLISQHVDAALLAAMKDTFVAKLLSGINFSKVQLLGIKKPGQNVPALYLKIYYSLLGIDTVFSDLLASSAGPKTVTCCVAKSPLSS
uniref:Uncharacterized protein n=9 Tax=Enterobacteriaceae TaxID=543 RepID=A0A221ZQ99_ECOLX|nr:hypothetical protein [Escherichia coli]AWH58273.1 hypothetical protein P131681_00130 [Salmonella enterica subsp. enterica serovar Typhimurium var. monophasic 4,[5],12:i:-]QNI18928.1 hypothetical protein CDHFNHMB_00029 [Salmonella enterica subsp. enterica serovar Derby]QYD13027.1 hypothetical protein OEKINHEC_00170 [Salmonella enterica subsp. enterica serovar Typhimurium]WBR59975.1 hypothetical protein CPHELBEB_04003 [Salmonella sp.]WIW80273.1 hypothetical protein GIFMJBJA_00040 [Salmonella 